MKKLYLSLLLLTLAYTPLLAQIFVTEAGAGNKDGTSWLHAYDNTQLQRAINEAESAPVKQVWVAKGTYKPTESLSTSGFLTDGTTPVTDRDKAFILKTAVEIYGGFAGAENSVDDRVDIHTTNQTVLSGDFLGNDLSFPSMPVDDPGYVAAYAAYEASKADNAYHVVASRNASLAAVLNGFIIQHGFADGADTITEGGEAMSQNNGGAINVRGANTAMTFANLLIRDNKSTTFSAGVQLRGSGANKQYYFNKVTFENNMGGGSGGALYIYYTSTTTTVNITDCVFTNNSGAGDGGGAIITANSAGTINITNTNFINNTHTSYGGALRLGVGTANIVNCDFIGNSSRRGAIYATGAATTNIERNRFNNNSSTNDDGGQVYIYSGTLNIRKSSFYNGRALVGNGGAIYIRSSGEAARTSTVHVSNSVFYNNVAALGGAIYITRNTFSSNPNASSLTAVNNTFYSNKSTSASGGAVYFVNEAEVTLNLYNNIFNSNLQNYDSVNETGGTSYDFRRGVTVSTQRYYYNLVQSNTNLTDNGSRTVTPDPVNIPGNTNIVNADPSLLFASTNPGHDDFLWPVSNSVTTDAGNNALYDANVENITNPAPPPAPVPSDLLGNPRLEGTTIDLGAIEWGIVLPVTVSSFTANLANNRTQLKWSVGTEENVNRYEVERSQTGTDFTKVAEVSANGSANYQTADANPQIGVNYYRLKTIDNDGSHSYYGRIESVKVNSLSAEGIKIHPNPVKDGNLNVLLTGYTTGEYGYKLLNTSGSVVQQGTLNHNGSSISVSLLPSISKGLYILQLNNGANIKLIKQ